jgi:hypothetical protein
MTYEVKSMTDHPGEKDFTTSSSSDFAPPVLSSELANDASLTVSSYVDRVGEFLRTHERLFDNLQSMILTRRPLEMSILVVAINCVLLIYRVLAPPFLALVITFLLIASLTFIGSPFIVRYAKPYLFPPRSGRGGPEEPNRIRDPNELLLLVRGPVMLCGWIVHIIRGLAADETREGKLIWAGMLAWMCVLTASADWFPVVVVVVNGVLLLPVIWFNSQVMAWRLKLFGEGKSDVSETG